MSENTRRNLNNLDLANPRQAIAEAFTKVFGSQPEVVSLAPGRVEILGNHVDYNQGLVLAAAINRYNALAGGKIPGTEYKFHSCAFNKTINFDLSKIEQLQKNTWVNYPNGVVSRLLLANIKLGGFAAVIDGNVPLGSGLSSSAALEVATAYFLKQLYPYELSATEIALLCQAAENKFVGVNCGILDQYTSTMGEKDRLVMLDCQDLSRSTTIPLSSDVALVIANTMAHHSLVDGAYNKLREYCFAACKWLDEHIPERRIESLRDVTVDEFNTLAEQMPDELRRHARHVVTEIDRVKRGKIALEQNDLVSFGKFMHESHKSSRDDFGNSCLELDIMVDKAMSLDGCYGARLSGGGFGGSAVCLVKNSKAEEIRDKLAKLYAEETKIQPEIAIYYTEDGAARINR